MRVNDVYELVKANGFRSALALQAHAGYWEALDATCRSTRHVHAALR